MMTNFGPPRLFWLLWLVWIVDELLRGLIDTKQSPEVFVLQKILFENALFYFICHANNPIISMYFHPLEEYGINIEAISFLLQVFHHPHDKIHWRQPTNHSDTLFHAIFYCELYRFFYRLFYRLYCRPFCSFLRKGAEESKHFKS
mmetsp:Transcript_6209/g.23431  ORF Transcript_6209/g.23431 Transcript_6209/m.23431 type:complete len:145 (+) Transcript_6209:2228-2662(+)